MIPELQTLNVPAWLQDPMFGNLMNGPFPLREILKDSLYYPSSHFDGDPVKYLGGNILSFIYVDYGVNNDDFANALKAGFCGYKLVSTRSINEQELTPHGWRPTQPLPTDGDPSRYRDWVKKPFCSWSLFERLDDFPISHGPFRFSLLFLCADGVAAFQALYEANSTFPKAVAIIQPGTGFGCNWTNFENPEQVFARSVFSNRSGQPDFLLYGGFGRRDFYREPCWPHYQTLVRFLDKAGGGTIGVWARSP